MDSRPAKRQRKLVVNSSDSEFEPQAGDNNAALNPSAEPTAIGVAKSASVGHLKPSSGSNPKSVSLRSSPSKARSRAPSRAHATHRASFSASPEKGQYGNAPSTDTTAPPKSLHSFFQPATEEQRWSSQKFESRRAWDPVKKKVDDSDDLIQDDYDSYDELFTKHFSDRKPSIPNGSEPPQKQRGQLSRSSSMNSDHSRKLTSSKAFLMPSSSSNIGSRGLVSHDRVYREDKRPWAQRFPPLNLEELAVHKRKVADVRSWLENVFSGRDRRVCGSFSDFLCLLCTFCWLL